MNGGTSLNQQTIYKVLNMRFQETILDHGLPKLDESIFSHSDCTRIRAYLYKAPSNNEALIKNFIRLLYKGKVEEAELIDNACILTIKIAHKKEGYHAQIKLEHGNWSFITLYYTGKTTIWKVEGEYKRGILFLVSLGMLAMLIYVALHWTSMPSLHLFPKNENIELISDSQQHPPIEMEVSDEEEAKKQVDNKKIMDEKKQIDVEIDDTDQIMEETEKQQVHIVISPGMTSLEISQLLYNHGIINNAAELNHFFHSNNVNRRLKQGSYYIPMGISYQEIVHMLTGTN